MKHGLSRTPEYASWCAMMHRCTNPKSQSYRRYGGRGITVSPDWQNLMTFVKDMGKRPTPAHTLEREDNDGPYSKENCRWALVGAQNKNRSVSRALTHEGVTRSVQEWADLSGLKYTTLLRRVVDHGWSVERALSTTVEGSRSMRARNEKGQYD